MRWESYGRLNRIVFLIDGSQKSQKFEKKSRKMEWKSISDQHSDAREERFQSIKL